MHKWYTKGGEFLSKPATWHQDCTWMAMLPCQPLTHIKHIKSIAWVQGTVRMAQRISEMQSAHQNADSASDEG